MHGRTVLECRLIHSFVRFLLLKTECSVDLSSTDATDATPPEWWLSEVCCSPIEQRRLKLCFLVSVCLLSLSFMAIRL